MSFGCIYILFISVVLVDNILRVNTSPFIKIRKVIKKLMRFFCTSTIISLKSNLILLFGASISMKETILSLPKGQIKPFNDKCGCKFP